MSDFFLSTQALHAKDVSLTIGGKKVLHHIDFAVNADDFISIIGPNGAGKTSLLKILLGIIAPTTGVVHRQQGLRVGYMPQQLAVNPLFPLTAQRFLTLANQATLQEVHGLAETLTITHLLPKQLSQLSGGERQRLLLARALLGNPQILLLDEPVQSLDVQGQAQFYQLLEHLHKTRKLAIVMVSHDIHMVMRTTRRVVCLFQHICCEGKPVEISQNPKFLELFGAEASNIMAVYQHSHNHSHDHQH